LKFVQQRLQKPPPSDFEEIDAPLIVAFLDDLERHASASAVGISV